MLRTDLNTLKDGVRGSQQGMSIHVADDENSERDRKQRVRHDERGESNRPTEHVQGDTFIRQSVYGWNADVCHLLELLQGQLRVPLQTVV